jgi:hypothetical protein
MVSPSTRDYWICIFAAFYIWLDRLNGSCLCLLRRNSKAYAHSSLKALGLY